MDSVYFLLEGSDSCFLGVNPHWPCALIAMANYFTSVLALEAYLQSLLRFGGVRQ